MSYRRDPTYLAYDIWKSLQMITQAYQLPGSITNPTVEDLVDGILRTHITENYPQLLEHQKQIAKLEKEVIKTLHEQK